MSVRVRKAALRDLEVILALTRDFVVSFPVDEAAFRANFARLISQPDTLFAVAEQDGQTVGYILGGVHLTLYANGIVAWVDELMVRADRRKQGVGRELMSAFEQWAAENQAVLVTLATRRAAPFYEALGFRQTAGYFKKQLAN